MKWKNHRCVPRCVKQSLLNQYIHMKHSFHFLPTTRTIIDIKPSSHSHGQGNVAITDLASVICRNLKRPHYDLTLNGPNDPHNMCNDFGRCMDNALGQLRHRSAN